jgi:hypothetical protein
MAVQFIPSLINLGARGLSALRSAGRYAKDNKIKTTAGTLGAGGLTYGLLSDDDPVVANQISDIQLPTTTVTAPREVPYVPSSNTTSLVDEARRQKRQAEIVQQAIFRNNILNTIYGKSNYGQSVIDDLARKEKARGNVRVAMQLEAIKNKDGSMPDNARTVYNRLIAENMDPEMASQYAGIPLQMSKTESEIMENFQTGQPSVMDTLKPEYQIAQAQGVYASGNQSQKEKAVEQIIGLITSGAIDLKDVVAGFERPLTDRELTKIAKQILTGKVGVSDTGVDTSDIVLGIN